MTSHTLTFITPLFSKGSYDDQPEVRPASIRGQLHWWFRALGGSHADETALFGGVHTKPPVASKVVIRVANDQGQTATPNTLPHKDGGRAAPKSAFQTGTTFDLLVSERLGGLDDSHRKQFQRALDAWLLAGALGLRATRGGGAFHRAGAPTDAAAYRKQLGGLLADTPLAFELLDKPFDSAEAAREVITETISHQAFQAEKYPLGGINLGNMQRKTSPLRLTVRRFDDGFRILALWDGREAVTGNTRDHLRQAIQKLANGTSKSKSTEIGKLLAASQLA